MFASIKSEFRKLLSIRSTFVITLLGLLLVGGLLDLYAQGYRAVEFIENPHFIESISLMNVNFLSIFAGVVCLLIITHEYRYNTIAYTLTSSNSRTKSFIAKICVLAVYAVVVGAFITIVGPLLAKLGVAMQGKSLAPQIIDYGDIAWRAIFYSFGNAMAAAIIAFLIRNQIGAIATYFIVVNTVEELLAFILKDNAKFLPFRTLNEVVNFSTQSGAVVKDTGALTITENALVFTLYMVVGLLISWFLFLRRDAN